jgi:hypothetical protein
MTSAAYLLFYQRRGLVNNFEQVLETFHARIPELPPVVESNANIPHVPLMPQDFKSSIESRRSLYEGL